MARTSTPDEPEVEPGLALDPDAVPSDRSATVVERLLAAKGYQFERTGKMTPAVIEAVRHFQASVGLEVNGAVGRGDDPTWKELNK
jgi:peptidoglycan hydrolase-like protein with peptidoglycan-binding domain